MVVATVVIYRFYLEYFDHQDSGTFRCLLAPGLCHNASRTSCLRNPEQRNSLPCFQQKQKEPNILISLRMMLVADSKILLFIERVLTTFINYQPIMIGRRRTVEVLLLRWITSSKFNAIWPRWPWLGHYHSQ